MTRENIYIKDKRSNQINFYKEFDDCWLGIKDTPHEFLIEITEQEYLSYIDLNGSTIEDYKLLKLKSLSSLKEEKLKTVIYNNNIYDSDDSSINKLSIVNDRYDEFTRKNNLIGINWITSDNKVVNLSKIDFSNLILLIFRNQLKMRTIAYPLYKDKIQKSINKFSIDKLVTEFENLDISIL